jgi:hypothetical protein
VTPEIKKKLDKKVCVMKVDSEVISKTYQEMVEQIAPDKNGTGNSYKKISQSSEMGVVVYVYDLGKFLFEHLDKIKNKPVSILQIAFEPVEPKEASFETLDGIDFDVVYPSLLCNTTYPCQHTLYVHLEGDDENTWYSLKNKMRGDEIYKKYAKYLPKSFRDHFLCYASCIC